MVGLAKGGFYLNGERLPATSIHYRTLYRIMNTHQITSATFTSPVSPTDLADLAATSAGITTDRPAGGTVRVNDVAPLEDRPDKARLSDGEVNRFRAWVNRWRDTDDRELQAITEAIISSDETRHYQAWLKRTQPEDDTETDAYLDDSHTPDWLQPTS
jgi:hypothetical protein